MTGKPSGRGGSRPGAGRKSKAQTAEIKQAKNQTAGSGRGGARPGAGRKPKADVAPNSEAAPKATPRRAAKKEELEPQAHGGALKRTKATPVVIEDDRDMLTLMQDIALGRVEATMVQVRAATATLPFLYAKKGEGGKKEAQQEAAQAAASKFGRAPPSPRLAASGGKKL